MSMAFGPTSCSSGLVPKSELLHSPESQYGFVPKNSLHGGKDPALRAEKPYLAMTATQKLGELRHCQRCSFSRRSAFLASRW